MPSRRSLQYLFSRFIRFRQFAVFKESVFRPVDMAEGVQILRLCLCREVRSLLDDEFEPVVRDFLSLTPTVVSIADQEAPKFLKHVFDGVRTVDPRQVPKNRGGGNLLPVFKFVPARRGGFGEGLRTASHAGHLRWDVEKLVGVP